jgi:hypothetical protein
MWGLDAGRILSPVGVASCYDPSAPPFPGQELRSLQLTMYDPGSAAYRYHSAANTAPGGRSVFARFDHTNPHCDLRQLDGDDDERAVLACFDDADVVHVHMNYDAFGRLQRWPRPDQLLVRHYHGSNAKLTAAADDESSVFNFALDQEVDAVLIGARLYHTRFHPAMHWLPIPVPAWDYERLALDFFVPREHRPNKCWRIAHSPTNSAIKGTMALQVAIDDLRIKGLPIELVLIQGKPHGEALALKATCDITFDSFWLGIQGSGLEGAAMGQAVIAGDPDVKAEYEREIGYCPYTYAKDFSEIGGVLERLLNDDQYRATEAERVQRYVHQVHDYPVVGARYWSIIAQELAKRAGAPKKRAPRPVPPHAAVERPEGKPVTRPRAREDERPRQRPIEQRIEQRHG